MSSVGAGAKELKLGEWVFCGPILFARDAQELLAIMLQGLTANGPSAMAIQQ